MPDNGDKVKALYQTVSKDYDVGSFDEFSTKLQDPSKRKAFYDGVGKEYNLGDFKSFESKVIPPSQPKDNILTAATKVASIGKDVSIQPVENQVSQKAKTESKAKRLKKVNAVYDIAQKGAYTVAMQEADKAQAKAIPIGASQIDQSYANIPSQVVMTFAELGGQVTSTVASVVREVEHTKSTGTLGAPKLYNPDGSISDYGKKIGWSDDFLGKMVLGANGYSQDARNTVRERALPNTFMGNGMTHAIAMAPDFALASASGGTGLIGRTAAKGFVGAALEGGAAGFAKEAVLSPFAKALAVRGGVTNFSASEQSGGDLVDRFKEGGIGAATGVKDAMLMEVAGFAAGQFGKLAPEFLQYSKIIKQSNTSIDIAAHAVGNVMAFSGPALLLGDKQGAKDALFLAGLFSAIHGKNTVAQERMLNRQIKQINPALDIKNAPEMLVDIVHAQRMSNLYNASPEGIKTAFETKMSANDMNSQAIEYSRRALVERDPVKKKELMVVADTYRKSSDIKQSVESIIKNKADWNNYLDVNTRMTSEQKTTFRNKIDAIGREYNPIEKQKFELTQEIAPLEQRKAELEQSIKTEQDPVRKAEMEAERAVVDSQSKELSTSLQDITARELTGDIQVNNKGEVVKLKTEVERVKEMEDVDVKVKRFQEKNPEAKLDPIDNIPAAVERTFERIERDIPTDPVAIKETSDWLYGKYKELTAMKKSDSRRLTIEQIEAVQDQLGKDIAVLENYKYKNGETTRTIEPTQQAENGPISEAVKSEKGTTSGESTVATATKKGPAGSVKEINAQAQELLTTYRDILKRDGLYELARDERAPADAIKRARAEAEAAYGKTVAEIKAEAETLTAKEEAAKSTPEPAKPEAPAAEPVKTEPVKEEAPRPKKPKEPKKVEDNGKPAEVTTETGEKIPINHAAMKEVLESIGSEMLPKNGTTRDAIVAEAVADIKSGYNVKELFERMDGPAMLPSAKEQAIAGLYIEALNQKNNSTPTPELINEITKSSRLLIAARSRIALALGVTKSLVAPKMDLTTELVLEQEAMGVRRLAPEDIKRVREEFERAQENKKKWEEGEVKAQNEQIESISFNEAVQREVQKIVDSMKRPGRPKGTSAVKKTSEDFARERSQIKAELIESLKKANRQAYATVPLVPQLTAMAPHVAKLVKSYVEEGVVKLEEILIRLNDDVDYARLGIGDDDIKDVILGKYNAPRKKKSEVAQHIADIKEEIKLLSQIEKLETQPPSRNRIQQQRRTEKIEELREQVAEAKRKNKELFPEEYDNISSDRRKKMYLDKAKELQEYLKDGGFAPDRVKPREVKLDAEAQKAQDEYIAYTIESNRRRDNWRFEQRSNLDKALHHTRDIVGLTRLAQTSFDLSMPFRQVITATLAPRRWGVSASELAQGRGWRALPGNIKASQNAKAWGNMLRSAFSHPRVYNRLMFQMENTDAYKRMVADGVVFNSITALENKYRNEDFRTSFIYKIPDMAAKLPLPVQLMLDPVVGAVKAIQASQRGADSFVNTARYEMYTNMEQKFLQEGITRENSPETYKEAAKWAMNMTGRGNFLKALESPQMQTYLGNTFYGARLMASRFNLLNPVYYAKMPPEVRKEAMRDITSFIASYSIIALAAQSAGFTVSLNPDEADFLKIKKGDTRYDITGGKAQYIRTAFRMLKTLTNNFNPNVSANQESKYGAFAARSVVSFFDYKLSPEASYLLGAIRKKDALGNDFDPTTILKAYPMWVDDFNEGISKGDISGSVAMFVVSGFGIGAQTYGNQDERKAPELKLQEVKYRGNVYEVANEKNANILDERKKAYEDYINQNGPSIRASYKAEKEALKPMVERDKKAGKNEAELQYMYKKYYMEDKDVEQKIEDAAIKASSNLIIQKYIEGKQKPALRMLDQ